MQSMFLPVVAVAFSSPMKTMVPVPQPLTLPMNTSVRLTVDVDDTPENRLFFSDFKTILLQRFEQIEIYIVSYPVDIL